MQIETILP